MIQLTFDDLIYEDKFCSNEVINSLVKDIDNVLSKGKEFLPNITKVGKDYDVWEHVPNLGERLSYVIYFDCEFINSPNKYCGVGVIKLHEIFDFEGLRKRNNKVEVSVSISPIFIHISTIER